MALIQCPGCGRNISDKALKCPGCGWMSGLGTKAQKSEEPFSDIQQLKIGKELKQVRQEKELLEKRVAELENRIPEIIDNTDYEAIEKLRRENERLKNDYNKLIKEKREFSQNGDVGCNRTFMPFLNKRMIIIGIVSTVIVLIACIVAISIIATKPVVKEELNDQAGGNAAMQSDLKNVSADNLDAADGDNVYNGNLINTHSDLYYEKKGVFRIMLDSAEISDDTEILSLFFKIDNLQEDSGIQIFYNGLYFNGIMIDSSRSLKEVAAGKSAIVEVTMSSQSFLKTNISTIKTIGMEYSTKGSNGEMETYTIENVNVKVDREGSAEQNEITKAPSGLTDEILGQIENTDDSIQDIYVVYTGMENDYSRIILYFKVINDSDEDIGLSYYYNGYMDNVSVKASIMSDFDGYIPSGKAAVIKAVFERDFILKNVGDIVNEVEISLENTDSNFAFSVLFEDLAIDVNEE